MFTKQATTSSRPLYELPSFVTVTCELSNTNLGVLNHGFIFVLQTAGAPSSRIAFIGPQAQAQAQAQAQQQQQEHGFPVRPSLPKI